MNSEQGNSQKANDETEQNNKEENKYKIFYTSYGYIKIQEKEIDNKSLSFYNFIKCGRNSLVGSIYKDNIKDNINIRLKSFNGSRKIIFIEKVNINSKINILIEKMPIEDSNMINYIRNSQHRWYSFKNELRELNPNFIFIENNLKDNELSFRTIPIFLI